jgi:hypothetical protein
VREAACQRQGEGLGQVGGRIVAEVLVGLLTDDPTTFLHTEFIPRRAADSRDPLFTMVDLLKLAGVA